MGPFADADGHDAPWLIDEVVPGEAAVIDDIVVRFEDAVREPVVAHKLPDVFDGVQLGRFGRQWQDGDVFGNEEIVRHVPSCLIHYEDGVGIVCDVAGYLDQMLVHGVGVAPRHDEGSRLAVPGADRTEYVCRARALIVRSGWS